MKNFILLLIFLMIFSVSIGDHNNSTVKLVHVFFRHGSRIPDEHETYPNDPYNNMFRTKFGQLTNKGKQESYQLGKILRKRYHDFLGEDFHPNVVFAKSTDVDRTKMTVMLVLAGLFPPYNNNKWSDELNWLPIPFAYTKTDEDYEFAKADSYCPAYAQEVNRLLRSDEVVQILEKHRGTLELITNRTGKPYHTMRDVFLLHQVLSSEQYMNLTIPSWAIAEFKSILYLTNMQCYYENYNTVLKKLGGGRMLTRVIKNMKDKIDCTLQPQERKIFLYSGHDSNVISILSSLNLYNLTFPNYNAAVLIELHEYYNSKDHFLKVFYLENVNTQPKAMYLEDCGYSCSFSKFREIILPNLPVNYTEECKSHIPLD